MKNETMSYGNPGDIRSTETARQRNQRLALSRRAQRGPEPTPVRIAEPGRVSAQGLVLTLASFRLADYGQVCEFLGLKPSMPKLSAEKVAKRDFRGKLVHR